MTFAASHTFKKYPFLRLLLCLIAGIILQWYLQLSIYFIITAAIIVSVSLIAFLFFPLQKKFSFRWLQGLFIMLLFVVTGAALIYTKDIRNEPGWAGDYYKASDQLIITLEEPLAEKNNSYKALASINAIQQNNEWRNTKGKILVYLKKDSSAFDLSYGSQLLINTPLQTIINSGNPGAFDYNRYCLFQDITYQVFLKKDQYVVLAGKNINWLQQKLFEIRSTTIEILRHYIPDEKVQGVAEALLIGYRNDLDKDLVQAYSNTGVVHIIAISGLHLGMIYGLLVYLFSFFKRYKWTHWLRPFIILFVLWTFTLIAGAVPSILRSAVMFSFIVIGEVINRKTNMYNTLAASAFCMLIYNPFVLWDVGFLLSYAAVISIVTFMQPIYRWIYFQNKILDKIWQLSSVTISAQVLTLPVVIFYFHQFPNYFLITNLLVVPLSALILYGEILLLCVSFIGVLANAVGYVLYWLILFMNTFIEHVNSMPFSVWNNIQVNVLQTWLLYGFLIALCIGLMRKLSKPLIISLAFLTGFVVSFSIDIIQRNQQQKLIVYNVPKLSAIDVVQGNEYSFIGDSILLQDDFLRNFHLKPSRILYRTYSPLDESNFVINNKITKINNTTLLLIDNSFYYRHIQNKIPVDVIIISKNATVYMNQLQDAFNFGQLVFDSSNPLWKIERWKKDCDRLHLRFYSVPEQGAFVIDL
jgi:competence protein ComEC